MTSRSDLQHASDAMQLELFGDTADIGSWECQGSAQCGLMHCNTQRKEDMLIWRMLKGQNLVRKL